MITGCIEKGLNNLEENKTQLNSNVVKELNDEEFKDITGGSNLTLHFFNTKEEVRFIFFPGDIVYVKENIFSKTICCEVTFEHI